MPGKPGDPRNTYRWRKIRAQVLTAHRERHGNTCPGWHRPPHPSADLTVDHPTEIALGGDPYPDPEACRVLCRSCNSRKGNARRPRKTAARRAPPPTTRGEAPRSAVSVRGRSGASF